MGSHLAEHPPPQKDLACPKESWRIGLGMSICVAHLRLTLAVPGSSLLGHQVSAGVMFLPNCVQHLASKSNRLEPPNTAHPLY